jgi:hypothetical protein
MINCFLNIISERCRKNPGIKKPKIIFYFARFEISIKLRLLGHHTSGFLFENFSECRFEMQKRQESFYV